MYLSAMSVKRKRDMQGRFEPKNTGECGGCGSEPTHKYEWVMVSVSPISSEVITKRKKGYCCSVCKRELEQDAESNDNVVNFERVENAE